MKLRSTEHNVPVFFWAAL